LAKMNTNAATYIDWMWKGGVTPGLDIIQYTGTGSNASIAHNLGVAPSLVIVHAITTAGADQGWALWHTSAAATSYYGISTAGAVVDATVFTGVPTSSNILVGTSAKTNTSGDTYIAYVFADVAGFSKHGTYTGNSNADGTFIYLGFKPKYVMLRNTTTGANWHVQDSNVQGYNIVSKEVYWDSVAAESTNALVDFVSNGIKIRANNADINSTSAGMYIAFAESPFKYATAR